MFCICNLKIEMKLIKIVWVILGMASLQACTTHLNKTIWVSGFTIQCLEDQKEECFYISTSDSLDTDYWERTNQTIEGFSLEEGMLTKIEVKSSDSSQSSLADYTFVKVVEKKEDTRISLNGNWILTTINEGVLNRMITLPTLEFNLKEMQITGNGGCNRYFGAVELLSLKKISLGAIGVTQMNCAHQHIEDEYFEALSNVDQYIVEGDELSLLDEEGKVILTYLKQ